MYDWTARLIIGQLFQPGYQQTTAIDCNRYSRKTRSLSVRRTKGTIDVPVRPRVVVLEHSKERLFGSLADHLVVVQADTPEDAVEFVKSHRADGILVQRIQSDLESAGVPNAEDILRRVGVGVALVGQNLQLLWYNAAFSRLCEGEVGINAPVDQAFGAEDDKGQTLRPFLDCLGGVPSAVAPLRLPGGKRVELSVQPYAGANPGQPLLLCLARDITAEVKEHEKLIAIHRAGLELSHLSREELARMSTSERIDLLKANVLQYSQSILHFKVLEVRVLDAASSQLRVLISEGMTEFDNRRDLYARTEDNGVTGYVAATGASYRSDDVRKDAHYLPGARDARSCLTVPMVYGDRVVGTFNVESSEPRHFTEKDREFLEVFAREIAVALNTLNLLEAEKQSGSSDTADAILSEASLPVDDIIGDAIRVLEGLSSTEADTAETKAATERILASARAIRSSIQRASQASEPTLDGQHNESAILAGKRILIVDAEEPIRRSAHQLLSRTGCEVDTARNGREAVKRARAIKYDVILGDIRLPDMNGFEFFCAMRKEAPATPIALITGFGYDAAHSIVKARQEGVDVILYKPFRLDRLREAIENALDPQKQRQRATTMTMLSAKEML